MIRINVFWLLGLFLLALGSCVTEPVQQNHEPESLTDAFSDNAPSWVRTGKVNFSRNQYISGIGYSPRELPEADAYDQAKLEAFTDISTQIETFVENEFTSIQRTVFHNEDQNELVDFKSVSRQVTKEVLAGVEVVKRYYNPETGTACVAAVMDRFKLAQRLIKEAEDARLALDGHLEGYQQACAGDADPSQELKCLVHAHRSMEELKKSHLKTIAVGAPKEYHDRLKTLNNPELAARIIRDLGTLADSIRIVAVSGNEQKATLMGLLKEPVVVQVLAGGKKPLANFPIRLEVTDEDKATVVPQGNTTDGSGRFSFALQGLQATGKAANQVKVQLDFGAVAKGTTLSGPAMEATYFMPIKENTRIGVLVRETIDGEVNSSPHTGSAIKDALTGIGFQVIRLEKEVPLEEVLQMTHQSLVDRFSDTCEYLILGTAEAEFSSNDGTFFWYRTRLVLDALELETGKTIHFEVPMDDGTKGGQLTKNKAIRKSLSKASLVLVGDPKKKKAGLLTEKFITRFEGGEWQE